MRRHKHLLKRQRRAFPIGRTATGPTSLVDHAGHRSHRQKDNLETPRKEASGVNDDDASETLPKLC
jgi:hypothetical protein